MLFGKSKNIINQAVLDLRRYTSDALKNVKTINASSVIMPENPSEELMNAFGNVKYKNINNMLYLSDSKRLITFNGATVLGYENVALNSIYMFNGMSIVKYIKSDESIEVISNGLIVCSQNTKINFISQNGLAVYTPFEITNVRLFGHDTKIDSQFIESMPDGSVIAAGHNLIIYNDVTLELLKSKQIYFAAGQKIKCDYNILGYVQTIATAGNKIEVNE
ncbi:MAG: hypothetical protein K2H13_09300 [Eubacterium sp.]|nr:hypothetical protein [Eubacterium sp.]MDE6156489.1 hypothetical protein [Eubacterium sp.]